MSGPVLSRPVYGDRTLTPRVQRSPAHRGRRKEPDHAVRRPTIDGSSWPNEPKAPISWCSSAFSGQAGAGLMAGREPSMQAVLAMIHEEPADGSMLGMSSLLGRLCRAAVRALPVTGVGVSLMTSADIRGLSAASSTTSEAVEDLQFTLGEGPCRDAYAARQPVLIGDLSREVIRWPMYSPSARSHGVEAVFAFPFGVGTNSLGVMDVYQERPGPLSAPVLSGALTFAEAANRTILDNWEESGEDAGVLYLDEAIANRMELYQAQGMLTVQLDIGLDEAMARLRAHAFASDRHLGEVAHDIVSRRLILDSDGV